MQITVQATPVRLFQAGPLRNSPPRRDLSIRNMGPGTAYVGLTKRVTVSGPTGGYPLRQGEMLDDAELNEAFELWAVSDTSATVAAEVWVGESPWA